MSILRLACKALPVALLAATPSIHAATVDDFQQNQATISGAGSSTQDGSTSSILGGERDLQVTVTSGTISADVSLGVLKATGDAGASGSVLATWDGNDNDATTLANTGLAAQDLTASGDNAFLIGLNRVVGSPTITLIVHSGAGFSTFTSPPLTPSEFPQLLRVPYNTFSVGATFSSAGAIQLQVSGLNGATVDVDFLRTGSSTAPVVEALLTDVVLVDADGNGKASPGDTLRYVVTIKNNDATAKTGVNFNASTPANTTLGAVAAAPLARTDAPPSASSAPGQSFHGTFNTTLNIPAGSGLLANDFRGLPAANIVSFGVVSSAGISVGEAITAHAADTSATFDGGNSLTVNADGSVTLVPTSTFTGLIVFQYRLSNTSGTSDATATVAIGLRPAATTDSYNVTGNTTIDTTLGGLASLTANDTGDQLSITANTSPTKGTVSRTGANFTYTPNPGATGSDSFTYTLHNGFGDAPGTVNLTIANEIWYIDSSSVAGIEDGRSSTPFKTLASFNTANTGAADKPGDNDNIFIRQGTYQNNVAGGALTLRAGQKIIGDGWSGTFLTAFGFNLAAGSAKAAGTLVPGFTGTDPVIANTTAHGIALGSGNTIGGLTVGNTPSGFGLSGPAVGTLTVTDASKTGTGGAISITTSGTFGSTVSFNTLESTSSPGANLNLVGVTGTLAASSWGAGFAGSAATFAAINISGGSVSFTDPAGVTKSTTGALLNVAGGHTGTLTFQTGTLSATSGTGLQFDNADGTYNFNGTTTLNGGDAGIDILNGSSGTFNFSANTALTHDAAGTAFNLNGSAANVTYSGSITDNNGRAVDIDNHDAGTITFQTGSITANGVSANGIRVANSNGGGVNFNGQTTLTSQGNIAVDLTSNTGSAININASGNGLDITTTGGIGFNAAGGGTVTILGSGNSISSSSATALNVANTTIGSGGLTFQTISSGNNTLAADPVNGIVLNNTGSSGAGSLVVTGSGSTAVGGNGSGGLIQNTSDAGVLLTNTKAPSFTNLTIQNTGGSGIDGTGVTDFIFKNGTITGSGNASFESNIAFNDQVTGTENNLSGIVLISGNILSTAFDSGIDLVNGTGTLSDLSIINNTLTSATSATTSKGSGIIIDLRGTAAVVASLTKATVSGNTLANFPSGAGIKVLGGNPNSGGPLATVGVMGSATDIIHITQNSIQGQSSSSQMGSNGIEVTMNGKGQGNFDISDNTPINHVKGNGLALSVFGQATVTGSIANNAIVANNTFDSAGMAVGVDQTFGASDAPLLNATISNNQISQSQGNSLLAGARNSNGTANLDIANNVVGAPTGGVRPGIRIDSGTPLASGTDTSVCIALTGNTSAGSGGHQGIGLRKEGTSTTVNTFNIEGMVATSSPNVEAYVVSQNPLGGGVLLLAATSGFGNCTAP